MRNVFLQTGKREKAEKGRGSDEVESVFPVDEGRQWISTGR